jgi:hypothetical protein
MHDALVKVLDDSVVRAIDMNGYLGHRPGVTSVKSGQGDRPETVIASPRERAHYIRRTT